LAFETLITNAVLAQIDSPKQPEIAIMVNSQSPLPEAFSSLDLSNLDFSKYFIVIAFMGSQTVTGPKIFPYLEILMGTARRI
jgi:hypothetical protein